MSTSLPDTYRSNRRMVKTRQLYCDGVYVYSNDAKLLNELANKLGIEPQKEEVTQLKIKPQDIRVIEMMGGVMVRSRKFMNVIKQEGGLV